MASSEIPKTYLPENLDRAPDADISLPVGKVLLSYSPPAPQTLTIRNTLSLVINGVDALEHLDISRPSADLALLKYPLFIGGYLVCIAQAIEQTMSGNTYQLSAGVIYHAAANWRKRLPLESQPYRKHGISFPTAFQFVMQKMDPMWSEHEDADVIAQIVSVLKQAGESQTYRMMNTRSTGYMKWVEPIDRVDGVAIEVDGAISAPLPYVDVEALYHFPSNSRAYFYGYDYIINSAGRLVFLCADAPGRVAGAAVSGSGPSVERPAAAAFSNATWFQFQTDPIAVFSADEKNEITGLDFFIKPPKVVKDGGYLSYQDGSSYLGKVIAFVPRTGETVTLYDPAVRAEKFNGSVSFATPFKMLPGDIIQIYQVRPPVFIDDTGAEVADVNPVVDMVVWLNRRVTLLGPHAGQAKQRLNYLWTQIAGGDVGSLTLVDRLRCAAALNARMKKDLASFATYVEALLGLPLGPMDGYVTGLFQPDPSGVVEGQIDVYGALQEFSTTLDLAVALGDKVSFLQSLTKPTDGVTITDLYSDPGFMQFASDGTPPNDDPGAVDYVRTKIAGPINLPADFSAAYPTGNQLFFAAEILKSKSFRIDLGVYASQRLLADPLSVGRIFEAIDAVKPSGTDYWIRLADGTAITRSVSNLAGTVTDISAKLGLPTNFPNRIYEDEAFATGQWQAFYVKTLGIPAPIAGDTFLLTVKNSDVGGSVNLSLSETLTVTDIAASPLYPLDPLLQRWADAVNAALTTTPNRVLADVQNHMLRLRIYSAAADYEELAYTNVLRASAQQTGGSGSTTLSPSSLTRVAPPFPSCVWNSLEDAVATMNGYMELAIGSGPSYTDVRDFGAGPFDPSSYGPTSGPDTWSSVGSTANPSYTKVGRIRVEGYIYSVGGAMDARIDVGYDSLPVAVPGATISITVDKTGDAAYPITITRAVRADDVDAKGVMIGLARELSQEPTLSQIFYAAYPVSPSDTSKTFVTFVPKDPDATDLGDFEFTVSASGWTPTLYLKNSTLVALTGTGPLSRFITPTGAQKVDVGIAFGSLPARTETISVYGPTPAGGGNRFSITADYYPQTMPALGTTVDVTFTSGGARKIVLQNMRVVVNGYEEYSRDADIYPLGSAGTLSSRAGTFTYNSDTNPPVLVVPTPVVIPYTEKSSAQIDTTPRLIAPANQKIYDFSEDFGFTEIYLGPETSLVRETRQRNTPSSPVTVVISFIAGSSILYKDNGDGTFTPLVLGTDYVENPSSGSVTVSLALASATIVGYVESTMYDYYFEGPYAVTADEQHFVNSAPGLRMLYNEPGASPNSYREANKDNLDGYGTNAIASPYDVAAYLNSDVPKNRAFGTDLNVIRYHSQVTIVKGQKP